MSKAFSSKLLGHCRTRNSRGPDSATLQERALIHERGCDQTADFLARSGSVSDLANLDGSASGRRHEPHRVEALRSPADRRPAHASDPDTEFEGDRGEAPAAPRIRE